MNLLLLTASNKKVRDCRDVCAESMRRYCILYPEIQYKVCDLPDSGEKSVYWYKIDLFKKWLRKTDFLLWLDPDAIIVGRKDFREMVHPTAAIQIGKDPNGINGGVVIYRNCPEAYNILNRTTSLFVHFREHAWGPQAAQASFIDECNVFYHPRPIWNTYPIHNEDESQSMILHWAGSPPNQPAKAMLERLNKSDLPTCASQEWTTHGSETEKQVMSCA